ncbi:hypothetical protein PVAP13_9NG570442 [Panicum virgatum]|uniref:Uncharacterized protein n=1 Tax=Panicum virgatum TaxID=38727 RepID=A0A8T0MYE5_PANVG|nr:hypothetical protein PVAP13_9NG570442 [Panicum virgatum]
MEAGQRRAVQPRCPGARTRAGEGIQCLDELERRALPATHSSPSSSPPALIPPPFSIPLFLVQAAARRRAPPRPPAHLPLQRPRAALACTIARAAPHSPPPEPLPPIPFPLATPLPPLSSSEPASPGWLRQEFRGPPPLKSCCPQPVGPRRHPCAPLLPLPSPCHRPPPLAVTRHRVPLTLAALHPD